MLNHFIYQTPIGPLLIEENGLAITRIEFAPSETQGQPSKLTELAYGQLDEYFKGNRKNFDLPLAPEGTTFQKSIWQELQKIPFGKTATYKDLAIAVNNPKASRAVGNANNKNPLPIVIPCHRCIGSNGKLTGYAGGLAIKEFLLNLERDPSK